MNIILKPFAWLLLMLYNIFGSYGFALIFFALIVKVILFPFSLKGKKGMIQMNMLSGKMQQIQKKYATDKNKQNEEIQKLYAKEKVSPMSGCLWTMLPLFVLIPLYGVIREPLTHLMDLTGPQITTLIGALNSYLPVDLATTGGFFQLDAAHALFEHFSSVVANPTVAAFAKNLVPINFALFGVNLATVPQWQIWTQTINWNTVGLFLIPLISAATGLLFSQVSMKTNAVNAQSAAASNNSSMKMMMYMTPLMSLWIGFTMPAGLSIYWIANNVLSMAQEFISGKILKKDYEAAAVARERQELQEKEDEKRQRREAAERKAQAIAEGKKHKVKKPAADPDKKSDASVIDQSRVGTRSYARGRAYDPSRYSEGGPSDYADPGAIVTEETDAERDLEEQSEALGQVALAQAADEMIIDEILEEKGEDTAEADGDFESESAAEAEADGENDDQTKA